MAGEIQINSVTLATESSGSITAQLDTIRPNTTNGSLVLQGDSSDAGVTGLTIDSSGNATFAQTISGGTLGSSVVFPAGHPILLSSSENTSAVASVEFDNTVITSTYKHYILRIHRIIPATNAVSLNLAFSTDNGSTFKNAASGKLYSQIGAASTGNEYTSETANGMSLGTNLGNDADSGQSAEISIFGSQDTNYNYFNVKAWISGKQDTSDYSWWSGAYVNHAKTAINFLKLSFSSGNIAKHNLSLYGIK